MNKSDITRDYCMLKGPLAQKESVTPEALAGVPLILIQREIERLSTTMPPPLSSTADETELT